MLIPQFVFPKPETDRELYLNIIGIYLGEVVVSVEKCKVQTRETEIRVYKPKPPLRLPEIFSTSSGWKNVGKWKANYDKPVTVKKVESG